MKTFYIGLLTGPKHRPIETTVAGYKRVRVIFKEVTSDSPEVANYENKAYVKFDLQINQPITISSVGLYESTSPDERTMIPCDFRAVKLFQGDAIGFKPGSIKLCLVDGGADIAKRAKR